MDETLQRALEPLHGSWEAALEEAARGGGLTDRAGEERPAPPGSPTRVPDSSSAAGLTPAAVLVPLVWRPGGPRVLLTRRTSHLRDHGGQISFPGGRAEPPDASPTDTALRETREEIGLPDPRAEPLGSLAHCRTGTGFLIVPVVARVPGALDLARDLRPDPFEVEDVFEVPLEFFLDPGSLQVHERLYQGVRRPYYVFEYGPRYIWGATARILEDLVRRLRAGGA